MFYQGFKHVQYLTGEITIMKLKTTILSSLLILSKPIIAEEDCRVYVGGWSHHFSQTKNLNEVHNTIGLSYNNFELMYLKNSYNNYSTSLSYHYRPSTYFGVRLGVVSGYDNVKYNIEGVIPLIQPTFTLQAKDLGVEFGYLPYTGGNHKGVLTLTTFIKF